MDDWGVCPWAIGLIRIYTTPHASKFLSVAYPSNTQGKAIKPRTSIFQAEFGI